LRRSLACTNIIENMMGSIRRVCRNVKRWRNASMALRWTGAAMLEAAKGFRRLKAHSCQATRSFTSPLRKDDDSIPLFDRRAIPSSRPRYGDASRAVAILTGVGDRRRAGLGRQVVGVQARLSVSSRSRRR
jgi:hypothetical protein